MNTSTHTQAQEQGCLYILQRHTHTQDARSCTHVFAAAPSRPAAALATAVSQQQGGLEAGGSGRSAHLVFTQDDLKGKPVKDLKVGNDCLTVVSGSSWSS